jgi:hypothetical protein
MSKNSIIDHQVENPETDYVFLCNDANGDALYFKPKSYLIEHFHKRERNHYADENIFKENATILAIMLDPYVKSCH